MFWAILVSFVILQLVSIQAKYERDETIFATNENKIDFFIRNEILSKMSLNTQGLWKITPKSQNIQFFPILETIRDNMILIQIYYENGLASFYFKNRFLEAPLELANLLDKLQRPASVNLKFKNAIFYDNALTNKEYLEDIMKYYHSEAYKFSYASNNTDEVESSIQKSQLIYRWMSRNTKGRKPEKEAIKLPPLAYFHTNVLHFAACWDVTKEISDDVLLFTLGTHDHRRSRRSPQILQIPTLNFENLTKLYVDTFHRKDRIGYYNDNQLRYEAIRIPFKSGDFAMAILLPHQTQTLDIFVNFAFEDYLEVLKRVGERQEYIHYIIPAMNLAMVTINENGVGINSEDPASCDSSLYQTRGNLENLDYKLFVVDRPFGAIIYYESTKLVLWQAWIRDPTSDLYLPRKFLSHTNARGEELEYKFIS